MTENANEWMRLSDAAQSLGISWERGWRLTLTCELVGKREGRSWFVSRTSVERYRQAHRRRAIRTTRETETEAGGRHSRLTKSPGGQEPSQFTDASETRDGS